MCGSMNGTTGFAIITDEELAGWIDSSVKSVVIDGRPFMEHNTNKIRSSININCSRLVKRRLQQDKLCIMELLGENCKPSDVDKVVVYDDQTENPSNLSSDHFLYILLSKLSQKFKDVRLLKGGFLQFYSTHPSFCECVAGSALSVDSRQRTSSSSGPTVGDCSAVTPNHPLLTSLSQPTMPVPEGPTKILPHVYIGSEEDAMRTETLARHGITHILNVSRACQWRKDYVPPSHFMRISVDDNHTERLLPHFAMAFRFMDKVKQANGRVLVHCLAGISRSPTCVIAYLMKTQNLPFEKAYRYVKERRAQISPNFNFLGQLAQFECRLKENTASSPATPVPDFNNCPFVRLASMRRRMAEREAAQQAAAKESDGHKSPNSSPASPPVPQLPLTSHSPDENLSLRSGIQRELSLPGSVMEVLQQEERSTLASMTSSVRRISPTLVERGLCSCHVETAQMIPS